MHNARLNQKGVTIIELLAVIVLLTIVLTLAFSATSLVSMHINGQTNKVNCKIMCGSPHMLRQRSFVLPAMLRY
ncbi:pilus assembly FimT family protein [Paenibacillus pini]|uniref:pilus assembly FimT family protein n=1 Tax=Paenibacillus pini TaxID=669461 RepID=UPI0009DDACD5